MVNACCCWRGDWPGPRPDVPLGEPPVSGRLRALPPLAFGDTVLFRVFRRTRPAPWYFASLPAGCDSDDAAGRFDLPLPDGTCYLATSLSGAVLEALQGFGEGLLPESELRARACARVSVPDAAPDAADLTDRVARGVGVTQALWAGPERARTQRWAAALHRAGWQALHVGVQHDPTGGLRSVALFDRAGVHAPYGDDGAWVWSSVALVDSADARACLAAHGITVTAGADLPVVSLEDSGLL